MKLIRSTTHTRNSWSRERFYLSRPIKSLKHAGIYAHTNTSHVSPRPLGNKVPYTESNERTRERERKSQVYRFVDLGSSRERAIRQKEIRGELDALCATCVRVSRQMCIIYTREFAQPRLCRVCVRLHAYGMSNNVERIHRSDFSSSIWGAYSLWIIW